MTLTQLRYVVALDTHQHFGRAAESCFVTQPTLSTQIKKLENHLNIEIFDRSKMPVLTTPVGEIVVKQARQILRESERVQELVDAQRGRLAGSLRLGLLPTVAPYLLPRILPAFTSSYPDVELKIEELQTRELIELLRSDQLDAACAAEHEQWFDGSLHHRPLFDEPFVAYIHKEHPLASHETICPDDIPISDLWLLSSGHCFRNQALQLCGDSNPALSRPVHFESGNLETLRSLVAHQGGLTLLPFLAVTDRQPHSTARIVPFSHPKPTRRISLIRSRLQIKSSLVDAFVKTCLNHIPEHLIIPDAV